MAYAGLVKRPNSQFENYNNNPEETHVQGGYSTFWPRGQRALCRRICNIRWKSFPEGKGMADEKERYKCFNPIISMLHHTFPNIIFRVWFL